MNFFNSLHTKKVPTFQVATVLLILSNIRVKHWKQNYLFPQIFSINSIITMPVRRCSYSYVQKVAIATVNLLIIIITHNLSGEPNIIITTVTYFAFDSQNNIDIMLWKNTVTVVALFCKTIFYVYTCRLSILLAFKPQFTNIEVSYLYYCIITTV